MSQRLLVKLTDRLEKGDFYEAHQIYRTIYYRLMRENRYNEVYNLLFDGCIKLLDRNQFVSGADLANLLLEMLIKLDSASALNRSQDELIANIRLMFEKISPNSPERMQFVNKSVRIKFLPTTIIRKQFAEILWKEKNFCDSRMHFLYSSDNGNNCALMLVEYQTSIGYPFEVDLMIAQFVLQVLCIENWQLAHNTFYGYTSNHPLIRSSKAPFTTPLLNFLCFLFIAIEKFRLVSHIVSIKFNPLFLPRGKSHVFNLLCNLYAKCLSQDPCYTDYLSQIGEIYFGVEKKPQAKGLFSNLFQSLFDFSPEESDPMHTENPVSALHRSDDVDLD